MSNAPAPAAIPIVGLDLDIRSGDAVWVAGDLGLCAGEAYCEQRFTLIAKCSPGDLLFHPTFGAGLGAFVGQAATEALLAEAAARMADQVNAEPYVALVVDVDVTMLDSGTLDVRTTWIPIGGTAPLTIRTLVGTPIATQ